MAGAVSCVGTAPVNWSSYWHPAAALCQATARRGQPKSVPSLNCGSYKMPTAALRQHRVVHICASLPVLLLYTVAGQTGVLRVGPERRQVTVSIAPNPSHLEVSPSAEHDKHSIAQHAMCSIQSQHRVIKVVVCVGHLQRHTSCTVVCGRQHCSWCSVLQHSSRL
jgi:hypothetical protein